MTNRLNARIDDELARKIEHLQAHTDLSVTDIVRASIEAYYDDFCAREGGDAARLLEATGFVGCAEGDPELSSTYKAEFQASLAPKVGR